MLKESVGATARLFWATSQLCQSPALCLSFLICEMGLCGNYTSEYLQPWCVTSTIAVLACSVPQHSLDIAGTRQIIPQPTPR